MTDGERKMRHCYKLMLAAQTPDASYHHIEIWIDASNYQPVKTRHYAESGKLLKTAYFRHYQNVLGQERPTETVIIDALDPNWVKRDVPEAWLQRDYLARFKPD